MSIYIHSLPHFVRFLIFKKNEEILKKCKKILDIIQITIIMYSIKRKEKEVLYEHEN